jgi:hypothetical protein
VNVGAGTPTGVDSITNTVTVSTLGEVNTANNSSSDTTSVLGLPKFTTDLADPSVCNGPGGLASVTATLTNTNQTALPARLPQMVVRLPGTELSMQGKLSRSAIKPKLEPTSHRARSFV